MQLLDAKIVGLLFLIVILRQHNPNCIGLFSDIENDYNLSLNKIHAFLIHYWARGIGDVILRTLFSRFKSFKQADQSSFFSIVNSGSIPNRLKMMAYLSIQKDYLL